MCELCLPRRTVLAGAAATVLAPFAGPVVARVAAASVQAGPPPIVPRADWGGHLAPAGPIPDEADVRFLLVHHTVNANDYSPDEVVGLLGGIYEFHTSPERGWPDIAYNFLIDRFGTVYEGRTGSLAGPKAADATGGSQGFAQLCCFIGDHSSSLPSEAAMASMVGMLAFLGDRHGLDLAPGATATFVSRGSNRHPAGAEVTTPTISGHRDMSSTACPGEAAYAMVADGTFAALATERRSGPLPATTSPPAEPATTSTTAAPATTTSAPPATTAPSASPAPPTTLSATEVAAPPSDDGAGVGVPAAVAATAAAAAAGALVMLRRRRHL